MKAIANERPPSMKTSDVLMLALTELLLTGLFPDGLMPLNNYDTSAMPRVWNGVETTLTRSTPGVAAA